ncbi:MAG TPA: hypothetical protein VL326_06615 [Kofleriaceae bacterium]|nr:hypothetical protein [Kofleriaceae bacterium]
MLLLLAGNAFAGRKRVVVLDFDGPKAEKFHEDLVKLIKKSHTVVSVDKWNAKAEELDAAKVTEKNVKKIAKKLKVDGVVTGKVEKRRDEYIIRLKLRSGTTGEILGNSVQTKADGPRLDGQAQRDIKEELIGAIEELESNHDGADEEEATEEEGPKTSKKDKDKDKEEEGSADEGSHKSGFSKKHDMDETTSKDEEKSEKKKKDEEKAEKKKKDEEEKAEREAKKDEEESDKRDEEKKEERSKKRKASREEEGEGEGEGEGSSVEESGDVDDVDAELKVAPSRRAIDAVVGLSFTARNLKFSYSQDLGKPPPGYKQVVPVPGAMVDITAYPMSFNHKPKGIISGIGLNILYDQVIKINSVKKYADGMGTLQEANLTTKENRWSVGGVFRYPLGMEKSSIVVGGTLSYGRQIFSVAQKLPNNDPTDIPNVAYTMLSPGGFVQAPVIPKVTLNAEAMFHLITNTGEIQTQAQYGPSTVTGFEFALGGDYMLMKNVFVRASFRYETIGFKFKGTDPMAQTHTRDTDPDQDVQGARDSYLGGTATVGYVY